MLAFWLTMLGGLVFAIGWLLDAPLVLAAGAATFVVGLAWFIVFAFRSARREGIGVVRAAARAAVSAVRLGLRLMP